MMYLLNAVYSVVKFNADGTVLLRNVSTGEEITKMLYVDLNSKHLRVGDAADSDRPVRD